jgi:hypothetical protein
MHTKNSAQFNLQDLTLFMLSGEEYKLRPLLGLPIA